MRLLTLALLVTWVFTNDTNNPLAANNAASFTQWFDRWTDSHWKGNGTETKKLP